MHEPDPNAIAYIVYERATAWIKDQQILDGEGWLEDENGDVGKAPFFRARMFFAMDTVFSREEMWEREVAWLDPANTRIVPLYTESFNEAIKEIETTADEGLNDPTGSISIGPFGLCMCVLRSPHILTIYRKERETV